MVTENQRAKGYPEVQTGPIENGFAPLLAVDIEQAGLLG